MKKVYRLFIIVVGVLLLSSCAVHNGYMNNSASLSQANFSYVNTNISGTASTLKILGIGGLERQAIVAEAKYNMLKQYPLKSNQTLVNITINWKKGFYFIIMTNTCIITADIVEFYSNDSIREIRNNQNGIDENNELYVASLKGTKWLSNNKQGNMTLKFKSKGKATLVYRKLNNKGFFVKNIIVNLKYTQYDSKVQIIQIDDNIITEVAINGNVMNYLGRKFVKHRFLK